jgi:hypothetical protein
MVEETIEELASYTGPGSNDDFAAFDTLLRLRGWAVTPRLWSRAELTCVAIVAIDPNMAYDCIVQKDSQGEFCLGVGFGSCYSFCLQLKIIKAEAWRSCMPSFKRS